jgi:uncharacterized protein
MRRALMVWGGWDGHTPKESVERFVPFLKQQGFEVIVKDTLDAYTDQALMSSLSLIIQSWTCGSITGEQWNGLNQAVASGIGLAGWHGGLCDSFRGHIDYQWMTGGQFLAHPGNIKSHDIHLTDFDDPVTAGLKDFTMQSEQYYMLVEPSSKVLATTTFDGVHDPLRKGVIMPYIWKRQWGKGRVFFNAIGHTFADFDVPEARIIMERGMLWAAK